MGELRGKPSAATLERYVLHFGPGQLPQLFRRGPIEQFHFGRGQDGLRLPQVG